MIDLYKKALLQLGRKEINRLVRYGIPNPDTGRADNP